MMQMTLLEAAAGMTKGAAKMAQTDPHGLTLTLVSVCVVFTGLLVLYFFYGLSGDIFSGKFKRKSGKAASTMPSDEEVAAAIGVSLYLNDSVHDEEPGCITIGRQGRSPWADKTLTFRRRPQ